MSTQLDETIVQLHQEGWSIPEIAQKLKSHLKNEEDYHAYCQFLNSIGFQKMLAQTLSEQLEKNEGIPWYYLFFFIYKYQTEMQSDVLRHFCSQEINWMNFFGSIYTKEEEELLQMQNNHLRNYYEKESNPQLKLERELHIARSQKFFEKEKQIIHQLLEMDSENPFFHKLKKDYERKKAIDTLNEYKTSNSSYLYDQIQPQQEEIKKQVAQMMNEFKKISQTKPELINDMTIILISTGYNDLALEFIENHLDKEDRKWLYLELLLECRQFFRCLTFVDQLFSEKSLSSEETFSLIYAKAQAYYGLKEYEKAKKTLEDLMKVNPRYRLAQELLSQWKTAHREKL